MGSLKDFFNRFRRLGGADPIKHVVVLMFENHSFDQMLGAFQSVYPQLNGVDPLRPLSNRDSTGREYRQLETRDTVVSPDPMHELANALRQLQGGNSGFVADYELDYPATTTMDRQRIMSYFPIGQLPALHALAQHFTICDHWFCSVPGPTWTNRFFVHSGTSMGLVRMPESAGDAGMFLRYTQDTIFDRLNERGIAWRVYFGDVPQSLVLRHQWRPRNARRYRHIRAFFADAEDHADAFPQYSFIEPSYMTGEQNDDHPPHSTMRAQRLLARVYNAIRANEALFNSTLLVVLYDEHGGFYDHVSPPSAVPPDAHRHEYTFDRLGVRVPALLASPWVERGVLSTEFDHTSLLRYLIDKWHLGELTTRVRNAQSFASAIRTTGSPRTDTPERLPVPPIALRMAAEEPPFGAAEDVTPAELAEPPNDLQRSLLAFTEHLEQTELPPVARPMVVAAAGPIGETQAARLRVDTFLAKQSAKAD
jgi:phospholipase C